MCKLNENDIVRDAYMLTSINRLQIISKLQKINAWKYINLVSEHFIILFSITLAHTKDTYHMNAE